MPSALFWCPANDPARGLASDAAAADGVGADGDPVRHGGSPRTHDEVRAWVGSRHLRDA